MVDRRDEDWKDTAAASMRLGVSDALRSLHYAHTIKDGIVRSGPPSIRHIGENSPNSSTINRNLRTIGLLGGSFDPAHEGHRSLSLEALSRLDLDHVWWLVAPQNPLKTRKAGALPKRLAQAREVANHPRIKVLDEESRLRTRFSADTVRRMQQKHDARFVFLMGADNLAQLDQWKRWCQLVQACPIAVFDRNPYSKVVLNSRAALKFGRHRLDENRAHRLAEMDPPAWTFIHMRPRSESSSAIRAANKRQQSSIKESEQ